MPQKPRYKKWTKKACKSEKSWWRSLAERRNISEYTETPEQAEARAKRNEDLLPRGLYEFHPSDIKFWIAEPSPEEAARKISEARFLSHVYKQPMI